MRIRWHRQGRVRRIRAHEVGRWAHRNKARAKEVIDNIEQFVGGNLDGVGLLCERATRQLEPQPEKWHRRRAGARFHHYVGRSSEQARSLLLQQGVVEELLRMGSSSETCTGSGFTNSGCCEVVDQHGC